MPEEEEAWKMKPTSTELPNSIDGTRDAAVSDIASGTLTSPITPWSPQNLQSLQSSATIRTTIEKTPASRRTQARINIKVQSPVQRSKEHVAPSRTRRPMSTAPELGARQVPVLQSPTVEQGRGDEAPSFDTSEETPQAAERVGRRFWSLLWTLTSMACITLLIPLAVLLLPYVTRHMGPRCSAGWCGNGTSSTITLVKPASYCNHRQTYTQRTPGPVLGEAAEHFQLPNGVSQEQFCRQQVDPDPRAGLPAPLLTGPEYSATRAELISLRHVLCHLDTQYWRSQVPYIPSLLPAPFCSSLVLSGYAVDAQNYNIVWRPASGEHYHHHFRSVRRSKQLLHNKVDMSFYMTIGGRREDSRNWSLVTETSTKLGIFLRNVQAEINGNTEGLHIDWNYPEDACSRRASAVAFSQIIEKLHRANIPLVISVPPDESRMQFYDLSNTATFVEFVIVKTHTLVRPGIVTCNGARVPAARVFNKIVEPINITLRHKFGYSMNVAPETFTTNVADLWVSSSGPSRWENYTSQPGKTHMAKVCLPPPKYYGTYDECYFTWRTDDNSTFRVATLLTRTAIRKRIKESYDEGMGIAPVMAYNIDLDDFEGSCSNGTDLSPIVDALATSSF